MKINFPANPAAARLVAILAGAAGSFILFAAYTVIPAVGLLCGLLAPFPALYATLRFGRITAVAVTFGTAATLAAFLGTQVAILYLLQCGVIAHFLPELLIRDYGIARIMVWSTAVNLLLFAAAALAFSALSGVNIHSAAVTEINGSISQALTIYEKAGVKGEELESMKKSMSMAAALISRIYPALMTVMLMVMAGFNLALIRRFTGTAGYATKLENFNNFRMPEQMIWLLIASGFALMPANPVINTPALNLIVILSVFYFLQGLAVLLTIIARLAYPGALRIGLYVMLLLQPYLAAMVALFGVFDLWGDFRTPRKQENL